MNMPDWDKLTPGPWEFVLSGGSPPLPEFLTHVVQRVGEDEPHIDFVFEDSPDNAAFIALARTIFDLQCRHPEWQCVQLNGGNWAIDEHGAETYTGMGRNPWEAWYNAGIARGEITP